MSELQPGTILGGKYCVDRLLAEGGMSRLYQGHPLHGAALVAIEQLNLSEGEPTAEDVEQFRKEYQILHSLRYPGLAHALDFMREGGEHFLVEEFVPGENLESRIQQSGHLPVAEAVDVIEQVLKVLSYLHGYDVIYRDLKPSNIILQRNGTLRLVDFGAARRFKRTASSGTVPLGTPGYAPPEQYGKAQSDARSDVAAGLPPNHPQRTGRPGPPQPMFPTSLRRLPGNKLRQIPRIPPQ